MNMQEKYEDAHTKQLMEAIATLQSADECKALFEDLCTISEIKAMAQRLEVARLLKQRVVYSEIVRQTGASTATISRVNRCLTYGADGYQTVLSRLDEAQS